MVLPDMNQGPEMPARCQDSQEQNDDTDSHDSDTQNHDVILINLNPEDRVGSCDKYKYHPNYDRNSNESTNSRSYCFVVFQSLITR